MMTATHAHIDPEAVCTAARELTTNFYPGLHTLVPEASNQVSVSRIGKTRDVTKFGIP